MTTLSEKLREAARRFNAVIGDPIPALSDKVKEVADHALQYEVLRDEQGVWYRVDFDGVVDWNAHSYPAPHLMVMQLLRYPYLAALARMYCETENEEYAHVARRMIEKRLDDDPVSPDWAPQAFDGPTQYDLRIGCRENPGWIGCLPYFLDSPAFDEAFLSRLVGTCEMQLDYLLQHVYPNRNIRLTHADVLLTNSLRLAFLPAAQTWREKGLEILRTELPWQIQADGSHMEAVPLYHRVIMELATYLWRLQQGMPELELPLSTDLVAQMHEYLAATTCPDGTPVPLHDTRILPPDAKGKASDEPPALRRRNAFRKEAGLPLIDPPTACHYPIANQVFLRDSWDDDATYIAFDAAPRKSWHWHPCQNHFILYANGRRLLEDPGYITDTPNFPRYGDTTRQHNTITIDGGNQAPAVTPMRHVREHEYDLISSAYSGGYWPIIRSANYGKGVYATHHRTVLWLHARNAVIVLDHVFCPTPEEQTHALECNWHLPVGDVIVDQKAATVRTCHPESNLLMHMPLMPQGTSIRLHEGEEEPLRGWIPGEWGRNFIPAPQISVMADAYVDWHADFATVLLPYAGTTTPTIQVEAAPPAGEEKPPAERAGKLLLAWDDGFTDEIWWMRDLTGALGRQKSFYTDAPLVHLGRSPHGTIEQKWCLDASFFELG